MFMETIRETQLNLKCYNNMKAIMLNIHSTKDNHPHRQKDRERERTENREIEADRYTERQKIYLDFCMTQQDITSILAKIPI